MAIISDGSLELQISQHQPRTRHQIHVELGRAPAAVKFLLDAALAGDLG